MRSSVWRGLAAAVYLAFVGVGVGVGVRADTLGKECYSNSDCADGATCVAGDSETSVQRCVAGTPCGGSVLGSCPGDEASGQLACIWRPDEKACTKSPGGCKEIDGALGIYKCISLDRCDTYFGDGQCSGSCSVNGKQCNGRGSCQLTSDSAAKPTFECACETGWNGTRCDNVIGDSCVEDVGQCGEHGTCVKNACTCKNGFTGAQCEIAPASLSASGSGSDIDTSSSSSSDASKSPVPSPSGTSKGSQGQANGSASAANNGDNITKSSGGPSALVIIMAVLVALIVVGAILFVVIARRKRRQQEAADATGFNRTDSVSQTPARTGPPTPKQKIVIM